MSAAHHRIFFLLQRTVHCLKTRADADLLRLGGVTTSQAAALSIIANQGPIPQRIIADTLSQRESAITTMANRLLDAGLITRTRSETDSRAYELKITAAGKKALKKMEAAFAEINQLLDSSFGKEGIETLAAGLKTVLEELDTSS